MTGSNSMYDKLYHAAQTLTEEQDQHWRSTVLISNCPPSNSTCLTASLPINITTATTTATATATATITTTTNTATLPPPISDNYQNDTISCHHNHDHSHGHSHDHNLDCNHNHNHNHNHKEMNNATISVDAKKALLRVADFVSPKDKLVQLCLALKCLTKGEKKQSDREASVANEHDHSSEVTPRPQKLKHSLIHSHSHLKAYTHSCSHMCSITPSRTP